jgi:hypothetical protein
MTSGSENGPVSCSSFTASGITIIIQYFKHVAKRLQSYASCKAVEVIASQLRYQAPLIDIKEW